MTEHQYNTVPPPAKPVNKPQKHIWMKVFAYLIMPLHMLILLRNVIFWLSHQELYDVNSTIPLVVFNIIFFFYDGVNIWVITKRVKNGHYILYAYFILFFCISLVTGLQGVWFLSVAILLAIVFGVYMTLNLVYFSRRKALFSPTMEQLDSAVELQAATKESQQA